MTREIIFLGVLVFVKAQLIYPDQYEQMKTTQIPKYVYSNAQQQSNVYPTSYNINQFPYPVPASQSASVPQAYPASIAGVYSAAGSATYPTSVPGALSAAAPAPYSTSIPVAYSTIGPGAQSAGGAAPYSGVRHVVYATPTPLVYSPSASGPLAIVNTSVEQTKQATPSQATAQIRANAIASNISPLAETLPLDWAYRVNDIISKGVTKLTLDLQNVIYNNNLAMASQMGNIVFSPLNIAGTLAMVHLGSSGITFDEVSRILGLASGVDISTHSELVHQMFGLLIQVVHHKVVESSRTVDIASAIFLQEGFPIRPEFKTISENVYHNEVQNLDFQQRGKVAQDTINAWVNDKTNGKISVLLNDIPAPTTNVIIASALYFKAEWDRHFLNAATARKPFFVESDQQIEVDMMYNGGNFPFYEDRNMGVKILGLPYKGLDTTMYILLPSTNGARALGEYTKTLTPEIIEFLIQNMKNQTCIVGMPRMKISSSLRLKQVLKNLGLTSLFDPATADLSLLSLGVGEQAKLDANVLQSSTMLSMSHTRPAKSMGNVDRQSNNNGEQLIFSRFGGEENDPGKEHRRHYFNYFDNVYNYNIEQWATGFSIRKMQSVRRNSKSEVKRIRRQSRPVSEDFLRIIENRNFHTFGLDNLRNSANIANPGLYADEVLHKVEIDINEKGTEAAAASAIILERDGRQKRLIANRPFLFFIRHNPTKLILFWGMINKPTPNYSNT